MQHPLEPTRRSRPPGRLALAFFMVALLLGGCGGMAGRFAGNLSAAMMDSDDPALVEAGAAAYLLLLDALVRQEPDRPAFRQAAAGLNSAYAGAFVKDPRRAAAFSAKALDYASEALCLQHEEFCQVRTLPVADLVQRLNELDEDDLGLIYTLGSTWAGWIRAHSEDFNAVADLPRVEALMQRVLALDESYQGGMAHLYLGVIATAVPPALGGRPEVGKAHFEKAVALSQEKNLMAKVYFARSYARGLYDRELHDKLLNEVKAADPHAPGWTLSNTLAQQEAEALLQSADEYF